MPLTVSAIKAAKPKDKDYKLYDERGLYLLVTKAGGKLWKFKYRKNGKEKKLSIGKFPEMTLEMARIARENARAKDDPAALKQAQKKAGLDATENSFEVIALEWIGKRGKKSESGDKRLLRLLEKDLFPYIGRLPVSDITPPTLLKALQRIEDRGAIETAHRAKQYAGQIFRYAIASGRAERDPSADLKGALATPTETHFSAITEPDETGRLMVSIEAYHGTPVVHSALKLSALLFCRQGELRHLEWDDVNFDDERIDIPGERMKMKEPLVIPLSKQALTILKDLKLLTGRHKYVFPSARGASRPLSENGVRTALRSMGYDNATMTPHGFRAMARTLLDEVLGFRIEWIEQQLAHQVKDINGRAYNRTKYLKQRRDMMQKWADYLDQLKVQAKAGNVINANFRAAK